MSGTGRIAFGLTEMMSDTASPDDDPDDRGFGRIELQLDGLALAFRDPEVLRQIETLRPLGSAIAVIQWGGPGETRIVIPFTHVETARDAKALGFRIGLIRRWMRASSSAH